MGVSTQESKKCQKGSFMKKTNNLYREDLILTSDATTKEEVLNEIGQYLYQKGLVKKSFQHAIIEREKDYPTGIDLSPVKSDLPNVAIPHTNIEHCIQQRILFVRLNNGVTFNNMIKPTEELEVCYLFVIINHQKGHTAILSELMEFITKSDNIERLNTLSSKKETYEFLVKNTRSEQK